MRRACNGWSVQAVERKNVVKSVKQVEMGKKTINVNLFLLGNSEEEIEEHEELTRNERRDSKKKKKKPVENDQQAMKTDF